MKNKIPSDEITALAAAVANLRASSHGRTKWPDAFKSRVVALTRGEFSVGEISRIIGICRALIDRWRREGNCEQKPVFSEMAVVNQRRTALEKASDENPILLRTPRGFVATLDISQMIALAESGAL